MKRNGSKISRIRFDINSSTIKYTIDVAVKYLTMRYISMHRVFHKFISKSILSLHPGHVSPSGTGALILIISYVQVIKRVYMSTYIYSREQLHVRIRLSSYVFIYLSACAHLHPHTLPVEGTQMCNFSLCIRVDELARVFLEKDMRIEEEEGREFQRNKRWRERENMK